MFEQSPFEGACNYAVWEVLVMLGGTLTLGVLLGYLIWGWTRKKLLLAEKKIGELETKNRKLNTELQAAKSLVRARSSQVTAARMLVQYLKTDIIAPESQSEHPIKEQVDLSEHWELIPPELDMPIELPPDAEQLSAASIIMEREISFNDLTVVEGVDSAIADVLGRSGINTWAQLASTTKHILRVVLDEAGPQFRVHKPKTWPRQAQMAMKGEWKKLKAYQDVVKGA